jgi:ankyrin repeat protein
MVLIVEICDLQDGITALIYAARGGHTEIARLLVENHADVNKQYDGMTALMYAAQGGHFEIARLLVENRADLNEQFKDVSNN